jgi:hypothetical protein
VLKVVGEMCVFSCAASIEQKSNLKAADFVDYYASKERLNSMKNNSCHFTANEKQL